MDDPDPEMREHRSAMNAVARMDALVADGQEENP